jgi:hypothetical protein
MAKTLYCANATISQLMGNTAIPWNSNTDLWVGLFTSNPTSAGTQTSEANYTSYARVAVVRSSWLNAPSSGASANAGAITFPQATGGSSTVSYFALLDAVTSGNMLFFGALTTPVAITTNITPSFTAGALTVTEA